ncbi:MAG TPA: glycoside hydrolase domain-containing protein [Polyangiaceae bacterium]
MKLGLLAFPDAMLVAGRVQAAPSVWAVDDGEKIRRDAIDTPFEHGVDNPVWQPGQPVRLFAMRNESVAMQVVVEADAQALDGVTVDLLALDGPDGAHIADTGIPAHAVGRPVERFVEHFVNVRRASGGKTAGESLGWEPGSGPAPYAWVGMVPDALIPVEHAPSWDAYPMHVEPRTNAVVWIDLNVPRDQHAGTYRGEVRVQAGKVPLATLPVELEVADAMLPDRTVDAMVYYDHELFEKREGGGAEQPMWQLLHAHRIAAMHDATAPEDLQRQRAALDGSLFVRARGYLGPAPGLGAGVLSFGAYGALGDPSDAAMSQLQALADTASELHLFGAADVFLYAADERCSSPRGGAWRKLIAESTDPAVRRVRVAWTCSQDPSAQPVDVAMLNSTWDPAQVKEARDQGKQVWEYNGSLPRTGTFLLDADAVSPRVNGWLQAIYGIPRWFYWDAAHWSDQHETEPVDPYEDPEGFHNDDGDWANGDGLLVYPGTQGSTFPEHSIGIQGVVPSIRLKNWRRGIEDAGYLQMARERDPGAARRVARWLVPAAFGEAATGKPPAWSTRGKPYFDARRALLAIALGQPQPALGDLPVPAYARAGEAAAAARATGCTRGATEAGGAFALVLVIGALAMARLRRLRSAALRAGARAPRADAAAGRT